MIEGRSAVIELGKDGQPVRMVWISSDGRKEVIPVKNASLKACKRACKDLFGVENPIVFTDVTPNASGNQS